MKHALAVGAGADRIAVMRDRRIQQLGAPQDVYQRPATVSAW